MNPRSLKRPIINGPKVISELSLRSVVEFLKEYENIPITDAAGQIIEVLGRFTGDAAPESEHPFKVSAYTKDGTPGYIVTLGTINGIVPTVAGVAMQVDSTKNFLSVPANVSSGNFLFKITVDDDEEYEGWVESVEVIFYNSAVSGATPDTVANPGGGRSDTNTLYLFFARQEEGVPANVIRESQQFIRLGPKSAAAPATPDDYSVWRNFTAG